MKVKGLRSIICSFLYVSYHSINSILQNLFVYWYQLVHYLCVVCDQGIRESSQQRDDSHRHIVDSRSAIVELTAKIAAIRQRAESSETMVHEITRGMLRNS